MKWPWVSRELYEQARADLQAEKSAHSATIDRLSALTRDALAMKRDGFTSVEHTTVAEPELPPALLMQAIREVSPVQDLTYAANFHYAMSLKPRWGDTNAMKDAAATIRFGRSGLDQYDREH